MKPGSSRASAPAWTERWRKPPGTPAHLLLGSDARKLVDQKLADLRAEDDAWKAMTL